MKLILMLLALVFSFGAAVSMAADSRFPADWGDPPKIQTRDLRPLPGGYGRGSSTLAKWIQKNLEEDKLKKKTPDGDKEKAKSEAKSEAGGDAGSSEKGSGKTGKVKVEAMKKLWNGKNFDEFEIKSGTATYAIVDGAIVGTTKERSPNTFLCTKRHYGDFELTFEVKCDNQLNSGVQIRSQLKGDKFGGRVNGPQIEIEASGSRGAEAGYVYGEAAGGWLTPKERLKPHVHFKDGEWNKYRIIAEGPRIRTWINGQAVEDLTHEEIYKTHHKGLIGLQVHGVGHNGPFTVAWRNLKIREIQD